MSSSGIDSSIERPSSAELRERLIKKATAPLFTVAEKACQNGDITTLRWYLSMTTIDTLNLGAFRDLFTAAIANIQIRTFRELLRQDTKTIESGSWTIFEILLEHPDPAMARAFCDRFGGERFDGDDRLFENILNREGPTSYKLTFLLRACSLPPQYSFIASILLEYGADPNPECDSLGIGALGRALASYHQCLSFLKEVVIVGKAPIRSIHILYAVQRRRSDFLKFVLRYGFEPWTDEWDDDDQLLITAEKTKDT